MKKKSGIKYNFVSQNTKKYSLFFFMGENHKHQTRVWLFKSDKKVFHVWNWLKRITFSRKTEEMFPLNKVFGSKKNITQRHTRKCFFFLSCKKCSFFKTASSKFSKCSTWISFCLCVKNVPAMCLQVIMMETRNTCERLRGV